MQIFYINLERSSIRARTLEANLKGIGLSARRVTAFDGATLTPAQHTNYNPNPRMERGDAALTNNEIACFVSHRQVWLAISGSEKPGLVLEDDVRIEPDIVDILEF